MHKRLRDPSQELLGVRICGRPEAIPIPRVVSRSPPVSRLQPDADGATVRSPSRIRWRGRWWETTAAEADGRPGTSHVITILPRTLAGEAGERRR